MTMIDRPHSTTDQLPPHSTTDQLPPHGDGTAGASARLHQELQDYPDRPIGQVKQNFGSSADDLFGTVVGNVEGVIGRGNMLADQRLEGSQSTLSGSLHSLDQIIPAPSTFWHSANDDTRVQDQINRDRRAFLEDPGSYVNALDAVATLLQQKVTNSLVGEPMTDQERDQARQLAENGAMMEVAMAGTNLVTNPNGLLKGSGYTADTLATIASEYGGNMNNINQIRSAEQLLEIRQLRGH